MYIFLCITNNLNNKSTPLKCNNTMWEDTTILFQMVNFQPASHPSIHPLVFYSCFSCAQGSSCSWRPAVLEHKLPVSYANNNLHLSQFSGPKLPDVYLLGLNGLIIRIVEKHMVLPNIPPKYLQLNWKRCNCITVSCTMGSLSKCKIFQLELCVWHCCPVSLYVAHTHLGLSRHRLTCPQPI